MLLCGASLKKPASSKKLLQLAFCKQRTAVMYNIPYFKEQEPEVILKFIQEHPFATMIGCNENQKPVATQVPVFLEQQNQRMVLTGHIMKGTDHHLAFTKNPNVLFVFTGPQAYVSATWYEHTNQASTWNYFSVHVSGRLRFLDEEGLIAVLKKTSLHFENYNTQSPTTFDNLPEDYRNKLLKAIVAFEVAVEKMENVCKLSQNKDEKTYLNIIEQLNDNDAVSRSVAAEMTKRRAQLFPPK